MRNQLRALLDQHGFGNSINAFVAAVAISTTGYAIYFAAAVVAQIFFAAMIITHSSIFKPAIANVIVNALAFGLLWRYWTPPRVIRFWLREIHDVAAPFWFAWHSGRRITALSPVLGVSLVITLAVLVPMSLSKVSKRTYHRPDKNAPEQMRELTHEEIVALQEQSLLADDQPPCAIQH